MTDKTKSLLNEKIIKSKTIRSVFIGNIPYDTSEEKLKAIFSVVGPVVSLKLVFDRETGRPKGYGFCEYNDEETALSAIRNLNGYDLNGRTLRVDNATHERFTEHIHNLHTSITGSFPSPYGPVMDSGLVPDAISQVVARLPPEKLRQLLFQMKCSVEMNESETRNMLIQNPQLAYALLQSLVVTQNVGIQEAAHILYRPNTELLQPLIPGTQPQVKHDLQSFTHHETHPQLNATHLMPYVIDNQLNTSYGPRTDFVSNLNDQRFDPSFRDRQQYMSGPINEWVGPNSAPVYNHYINPEFFNTNMIYEPIPGPSRELNPRQMPFISAEPNSGHIPNPIHLNAGPMAGMVRPMKINYNQKRGSSNPRSRGRGRARTNRNTGRARVRQTSWSHIHQPVSRERRLSDSGLETNGEKSTLLSEVMSLSEEQLSMSKKDNIRTQGSDL